MKIKVAFAYNEPRFGDIEIEGTQDYIEKEYDYDQGEMLDSQSETFHQNILDKIVEDFPEAIDIELTGLTETE